MQWQIYTGTWRVYEYMYMDADEIHLRCSAHAPDGTWRCSRFVSIPVFVSDLQPARLLWYRRWTREISPINRRWESRQSTHSQRLERNRRLKTKSGHVSNPYFIG